MNVWKKGDELSAYCIGCHKRNKIVHEMIKMMSSENFLRQTELEMSSSKRHKKQELAPSKQPSNDLKEVPEFDQLIGDDGMSYLECYSCHRNSVPINDQNRCLNMRCRSNRYASKNTGALH